MDAFFTWAGPYQPALPSQFWDNSTAINGDELAESGQKNNQPLIKHSRFTHENYRKLPKWQNNPINLTKHEWNFPLLFHK